MEEIISIILPCYNQGIYLGEALESIIKQTYRKTLEYPPNCSRLTQQDLIIRELEEKRRSWANS